ncbi:AAA family ATPase, partial [Desulfobulbus sp. F1]|nr:AAA family ATPase [Desulfobulbus sp. F1]
MKQQSDKEKKDSEKEVIEKALTKYARDIKNQLSEVNYDKRRFEPKVKVASEHHLLNDTELEECVTIYHSKDKKSELSHILISLSSVTELKEKATILMARTVTANSPILRLKECSRVESWVNQGRQLHIGKNECQFCGQLLPNDLINQMTGHFSADYENLMTELRQLTQSIQSAQKEEITLNHPSDLYTELSSRFSSQKDEIDRLIKTRHSALDILTTALTEKQTNQT